MKCNINSNLSFYPGCFLYTSLLSLILSACQIRPTPDKAEESLLAIPFNEVQLQDDFWKPRLAVQAATLVPFALNKTKPAVDNLTKAAKFLSGDTTDLPFPHRYISSDLYKVMEGAALLLMENPNPLLENKLDSIIHIIEGAQRSDGYLYVAHITGVSKDHDHWGGGGMGDRPYSFVLHSHELYNMGHMYEAAIAYYRATGKDKWLQIAEKNAQHINRVFFEGDPNYNDGKPVNQAPGHQEIELALVKLYQVTGKRLYLDMAKKFLDIRGITYQPEGVAYMSASYAHQHLPVVEQDQPVGHAVRATYMYSGMADVGTAYPTTVYDSALLKIWHNIVDTKMHITGGLGALHGIEGFGEAYELPNKDTYNETCAAVGNVFWNFRMFLRYKDAQFLDVAEIALYNNALAGVDLAGNRFFYVNPLESDGIHPFNHGKAGRSPWFGTACCPSNIARLIPQVSGMMYAHTSAAIFTGLYASNTTMIPLEDGAVSIEQVANYPFDGKITLRITPHKQPQVFTLNLRIPTWTGKQLVPGALYYYEKAVDQAWEIRVNGEQVVGEIDKGFIAIKKKWKDNELVELSLPMPVRINKTVDQVAANRGSLAFSRGPLVYCAEGIDNGGSIQEISVLGKQQLDTPSLYNPSEIILKDIIGITIPASKVLSGKDQPHQLRMIPYYAWNNREDGPMKVWLPVKKDSF